MLKNSTLLFCSILFSLIFTELIVRVFNLSPTISSLRVGHYVISQNPLLRYELKKNAKAYTEKQSAPEGVFWDGVNWGNFSTNSYVQVRGSNLLLALAYYFLYPRHLVSKLRRDALWKGGRVQIYS